VLSAVSCVLRHPRRRASGTIPLTDGTVAIRPLRAEDAPAFARAVADRDAVILAVLDAVDTKLIGLTMLFGLDRHNRTAES
jgi:hypothetical protein